MVSQIYFLFLKKEMQIYKHLQANIKAIYTCAKSGSFIVWLFLAE